MNVTSIRAGVKDLPSGQLVAKGRHVYACMSGNEHFPAPTPTLDTLLGACNALEEAAAEAVGRASAAVALRWVRHAELERILVKLSKYVLATAQGDVTKQVTSGFELRRPPLPITELQAPGFLTVRRPSSPDHDMLLHWGAVHGARIYQVYMTTEAPEHEQHWHLVHSGTSRRAHIRGLRKHLTHHFRVCAMGTAGIGPFSAVIGGEVWGWR